MRLTPLVPNTRGFPRRSRHYFNSTINTNTPNRHTRNTTRRFLFQPTNLMSRDNEDHQHMNSTYRRNLLRLISRTSKRRSRRNYPVNNGTNRLLLFQRQNTPLRPNSSRNLTSNKRNMLNIRHHHHPTGTKRTKNVVMKSTVHVRYIRLLPSNPVRTKITNIRPRNNPTYNFRPTRRIRRLFRHRLNTIMGNTLQLYRPRRNQISRATHVGSTINFLRRNHTPPNSRIEYTKTYTCGVCRLGTPSVHSTIIQRYQ